tara:strand:+ start:118 stop:1017 length:900 start_codon:yes stop_codon:yes gene_type:complete
MQTYDSDYDDDEPIPDEADDPTRLNSSSGAEDHINAYLNQPRYLGRSSYQSIQAVKKAGAKWDPAKKKWYAPNKDVLVELLETKKWTPDCLASGEQMLAMLSRQQEEECKAAHAAECAARKRTAPTEAQSEAYIIKWLGIPKSTDAEIQALAPWKILPELLELSSKEPRLGPRSGLSNAARLFMGLDRGWVVPAEIGVEPPRKKRSTESAPKALKAHRKLPTLPAFGKTSFSVMFDRAAVRVLSDRLQESTVAEAVQHNYCDICDEDATGMYVTCDICGEDSLYQFGCECLETAQTLSL